VLPINLHTKVCCAFWDRIQELLHFEAEIWVYLEQASQYKSSIPIYCFHKRLTGK